MISAFRRRTVGAGTRVAVSAARCWISQAALNDETVSPRKVKEYIRNPITWCMYVCVYRYTCMYICMHIYIYICVYVCVYIYICEYILSMLI